MAKVIDTVVENTSEQVARIAARGLRDPNSLTAKEIRTVCASALRQREAERMLEEVKRD